MTLRSSIGLASATVAVLLLVAAVYWPGLNGPFVLDDFQNIETVYEANPDFHDVVSTITHNSSGLLGRSFSVLTFVLSGIQFGEQPWGFKLHNLLIHIACGLLLFRLLVMTLPLLERQGRASHHLIIAGAVAALWQLHPLLVSTVLYAVQRMTQLATLFTLLALLAYLQTRQCSHPTQRFVVMGWLVFPTCCILAVLSKETGALIPLYILVFELCVFREKWAVLRARRHLTVWLAVFLVLPLLSGSVFAFINADSLADYSGRTFTLYERLLTQVHVLFFYVRLILLPRVRDMSLFHDDYPLTSEFDVVTLVLLLVLVIAVSLVWTLRQRLPVLAFGLGWFLVSHVLESSFIPLELVFEHRNYLASVGLILMPVYYAWANGSISWLRWLAPAFLVLFTIQTWARVQEWRSEESLMTLAVADHPQSPRARTSLANFLFKQNRLDDAAAELQTAHRLSFDDSGPTLHLLYTNCLRGVRDEALLGEAKSRLRAYAVSVYALNSLENLLVASNRGQCVIVTLSEISEIVDAALEQPANQQNPKTLGYLRRFQGVVAFRNGLYAQGVIKFREAHASSGIVSILGELVRNQIKLQRLDDAADTLAYIEKLNVENFGIETALVRDLAMELEGARLSTTIQ